MLAMVQSLSMKEYDEGTFDSFGLVVYDECHHLGAEVFQKSMAKVASKYSLGLSATPKRKDGLTKVFELFIGPIVFSQKTKNEDYVEVQLIKYDCQDENYCKEEKLLKAILYLEWLIASVIIIWELNWLTILQKIL